ncbi:hypothetical protein CONPUDRAFT_161229 [Coniophora puteana RWD-64-598 SS2]|uniref:Uncharacterized protein n=1 Tax=Coniophora puteana (strain RWD-64-598) TaxID=741705 RepID=A0A5M3N4Z1_CONPW|nr:uncharacterized protein CONPUDRAFT_161229 [Coniophora puteana RWD-64-598 SS2]EIW86490.1 hypothetical protein CONPUDRAFT_161229 [Coniophora puteana RWD-64-598 SS2]
MSSAPAKAKSGSSGGTAGKPHRAPGGSSTSQRGRKRKAATTQPTHSMHENEMIIAPPAADTAHARPELPTVHHPHPHPHSQPQPLFSNVTRAYPPGHGHGHPAHAPEPHHGHRARTSHTEAHQYPRPQRLSTSGSHDRDRDHNQPNPNTNRPSMRDPGPPRSMLQQAWHVALSSDPLVDSDEENPDGHVRLEYTRRLSVISRLRGRPPTPSPELDNAMLAPVQSLH